MTENTGVRTRAILHASFDVAEAVNLALIRMQRKLHLPGYS